MGRRQVARGWLAAGAHVIEAVLRGERRERREQVLAQRAADAAIRELDHLLVGLQHAAAAHELGVDVDARHVVHYQRDPAAVLVVEQVVEQRRLARAKEAREHRDGQPARAVGLHQARRLQHLEVGRRLHIGGLQPQRLAARQADLVARLLHVEANDRAGGAVELRPAFELGDEDFRAVRIVGGERRRRRRWSNKALLLQRHRIEQVGGSAVLCGSGRLGGGALVVRQLQRGLILNFCSERRLEEVGRQRSRHGVRDLRLQPSSTLAAKRLRCAGCGGAVRGAAVRCAKFPSSTVSSRSRRGRVRTSCTPA